MTFSDWLAIIGIVLAVTGILLACYFYRLSIRKRVPMYAINEVESEGHQQGSRFRSGAICSPRRSAIQDNLTAADVYFWNDGNEAIRKVDIHPPGFRIFLGEDGALVDAAVTKTTRDLCGFAVTRKAGGVEVTLDVAERTDGVVIQVLYQDLPGRIVH